MNNKFVKSIIGVGLGITLLSGAAMANSGNTQGYEAVKDALKNSKKIKNVTVDAKINVTDNGKKVITTDALFKKDKEEKNANGTITVNLGNEDIKMNIYKQNDQHYVQFDGSDDLYLKTKDEECMNGSRHCKFGNKNKKHSAEDIEKFEKVIDILMGDMKEKFVITKKDGNVKEVEFELNENEVPAIVQALAELKCGKNSKIHGNCNELEDCTVANCPIKKSGLLKKYAKDLKTLKVIQESKITQDLKIKKVKLNVVIENNFITNHSLTLSVTGKDAKGKTHNTTVNVDAKLSNINNTVVKEIDTTKYNVIEFKGHK